MPLQSGSSDKVISQNIGELLRSYRRTGKIGNARPKSMKEAREMAAAIAYQKAGKSRG